MSAQEAGGRPRPVDLCRALLDALDATEGRRRRRKRNTSADAIGIGMKRALLERALHDDPDPDAFEGWLLERCFEQGRGEGAWRAMALDIFQEWRMARAAPSFRAWLDAGAPSDDKSPSAAGDVHGAGRAAGPGLPLLLALLTLAAAGCGDGIEADVEGDVPTIEVREMSPEQAARAGSTAEVLPPLLAGPGLASTVYDPPLGLARPPDAAVWPPPTGTHGDRAVGAAPLSAPAAPAPAPDTAGGGSGASNLPGDSAGGS